MMNRKLTDAQVKARAAYFARTTHEERKKHFENWVLNHAQREMCPTCAGRRHALRLADCIVCCTCLCPKCKKLWRYEIDPTKAVKDRRPWWYYSKIQLGNIP